MYRETRSRHCSSRLPGLDRRQLRSGYRAAPEVGAGEVRHEAAIRRKDRDSRAASAHKHRQSMKRGHVDVHGNDAALFRDEACRCATLTYLQSVTQSCIRTRTTLYISGAFIETLDMQENVVFISCILKCQADTFAAFEEAPT